MLWPAALVAVALLWLCRAALLSWRLSQLLSASTTVQAATLGVRWAEGALEVGVAELRTKPPGAPFAPDVGAVAEAKTVVHLASIFKKVVDVREVSCRALLRLDVDGATGLLTLDGLARRRGARGDVPRPRLERRSSATEGLLDGLGEPFARALQNYEREVEACVGRVAALELVPFFWKSETRYRYRRFVAEDVELRVGRGAWARLGDAVEEGTVARAAARPAEESDLILAAAASATAAFRKLGDQEARCAPARRLLLQRAADVARRLEGVLSKANAEHIALDARHLDDQLLAALSDFALDLGASALTALPPGRVAGDANGVEYAVDHVDLSRVRVTHENLRVAFDRDLGSESLLHVDVYGVDCPLSDLRWSVGKKDSAARDEATRAAVSNICLGLDLVAARRPGDGRPGGGAPFLALRDARVTGLWPSLLRVARVDAERLPFSDGSSPPRTPPDRKRVRPEGASPRASPGFREVEATWI
ncbi:hypothetical protein JL722_12367 [Aureococcus anophagefferens]|nr:hypothetical protein JL722_12367 [Aureococcus anophagefferens]